MRFRFRLGWTGLLDFFFLCSWDGMVGVWVMVFIMLGYWVWV